jgi:hypothetical protein
VGRATIVLLGYDMRLWCCWSNVYDGGNEEFGAGGGPKFSKFSSLVQRLRKLILKLGKSVARAPKKLIFQFGSVWFSVSSLKVPALMAIVSITPRGSHAL